MIRSATWSWWAAALLLVLGAMPLVAAGGIRVRTGVSHEVVPVDVDFWSEIAVDVRTAEGDRPLPGIVFDFSCSTPDGRLALEPKREAEKESLRLRSNAKGQIRVHYRYASDSWQGEPLKRPRAERVRVKALQYDFDDKLVIQIGMNFAIRSFHLLHGGVHHLQAPEPFLLVLHDVWHPGLDLLPYRSLWANLRIESLAVEGLPDPPGRPPLGASVAAWIEGAPDPLEEVWGGDDLVNADMIDPGGKGGGGLLVPAGGSGEKTFRLPRLVWRRPGAAHVKIALRGVTGDTLPEDNEAELRFACKPLVETAGKGRRGAALPFDAALRYLVHQARGKIESAREGLTRSLDDEDFISFGRHLGGFFRVQARRLTRAGGPIDAGRATGVLMSMLLGNALERYLAMDEAGRTEVLRASKSFGVREEGFPVVDWIDPVVFGYLHERPKDLVVLVLRGDEGSKSPSSSMDLREGDRAVADIGADGPATGRQILSADRFAVACLSGETMGLEVALDEEALLVQTMQMLDDGTFLTRRRVLTGVKGTRARFPVGADPRAKIEILDGEGRVATSFDAKVAVSDRRPPRIERQSPEEGRRLPVEGGEVEVSWSVGRVGLSRANGTLLTLGGKTVAAGTDDKGRSFFKTGPLEPGFHPWTFRLEDAVGLGDELRSYFYVDRPAGEGARELPWIQAAPTRLALVTEPPTRRPAPRPTPPPTRPKPTKAPIVVRESPVVEDDLPVDVADPVPPERPTATFVPTPAATVVTPPPATVVAEQPTTAPAPTPPPSGQVMSDEEAARMYSYAATPSPEPPAAPAVDLTTPVPTPTVVTHEGELPLKVLEARLCHYVRNDEPVMPGLEFKRVTPRVTCWIRFENREAGSRINVRWSYLRGEAWMTVHESALELPRGTGVAQTALKVAKGGLFPEGSYRVEIHGALGLCWESPFQVVGLTEE